ncbi:hypothetical protein SAMN05444487_107101 [Marininema mesophilum]|uniref:Immunity MXAN-0049 protein domain-containing protein n=1 Tax=Marininema mesophilum TaxID=1048340 RepID=A0A1H2X821_9BACL|nr:DUF1629 domain-containing protein [Marininema mesophilum]SDW88409.1 hypothetical protein SAMN05444487_107101 [Marininema mesophilum]
MKVWALENDLEQDFEELQLLHFDSDYEKYMQKIQEAKSIADDWGRVEVFSLEEDGRECDSPKFWGGSCIPVFSEKALDVVNDMITDHTEVLPLKHPTNQYFIINVIQVIDAIDYNHSVLKELSSGLRVGFKKYAFHPERLLGQHIFKVYLDSRPHLNVLVSDEFKNRVEARFLTGFRFEKVWDSDER